MANEMVKQAPVVLIRHPRPLPIGAATESLSGYVLRLGENNGYMNSRRVLVLAGIRYVATLAGYKASKLAKVAHLPVAELDAIAYSGRKRHERFSCRLLNHILSSRELRVKDPAICPDCVFEKGFIDAHFDLALMVGCPIHKLSLLFSCPCCLGPLRRFRPGLLECRCGGNLRKAALPPISQNLADLLDVIRRNVLRLTVPETYTSGIPGRDLCALELSSLLALIRILGKKYWQVKGVGYIVDPKQIVIAASHVLSDWPTNFIRLLAEMSKNTSGDKIVQVKAGELRAIYDSLFNSGAVEPKEHATFLRAAFREYLAEARSRGLVTPRLLRGVQGDRFGRFVSRAEFAVRYNMSKHAAEGLIRKGIISARRVKVGGCNRIVIDLDSVQLPKSTPGGKVYSIKDTARIVGLSRAVLNELWASDHFEVKHKPDRSGCHELDITTFIHKMVALAPNTLPPSSGSDGTILVAEIMAGSYGSVCTKANVLRAILSKELPVVGKTSDTVGGLLVSRGRLRTFVSDQRAQEYGGRTCIETAESLQCAPPSIKGLVQLGLLKGRRSLRGLRVTECSIAEFKSKYVCLGVIVRQKKTTAFALMKYCRKRNISMLLVESRKGTQRAFVRLKDVRRILRYQSRNARAEMRRNRPRRQGGCSREVGHSTTYSLASQKQEAYVSRVFDRGDALAKLRAERDRIDNAIIAIEALDSISRAA